MSVLIFSSKNVPLVEGIRESPLEILDEDMAEFSYNALHPKSRKVKDIQGKWVDSKTGEQKRQEIYAFYLKYLRSKGYEDKKVPPCFDDMSLPQIDKFIKKVFAGDEENKQKKSLNTVQRIGLKAYQAGSEIASGKIPFSPAEEEGEEEDEEKEGKGKEENPTELTPEQVKEHHKILEDVEKQSHSKVSESLGKIWEFLSEQGKDFTKEVKRDVVSTAVELNPIYHGEIGSVDGSTDASHSEVGTDTTHTSVDDLTSASSEEEAVSTEKSSSHHHYHGLHPNRPLEDQIERSCKASASVSNKEKIIRLAKGGLTCVAAYYLFSSGGVGADALIEHAKTLVPHLENVSPILAHGLDSCLEVANHITEVVSDVGKDAAQHVMSPENFSSNPRRSMRNAVKRVGEIAASKHPILTTAVGVVKGTLNSLSPWANLTAGGA